VTEPSQPSANQPLNLRTVEVGARVKLGDDTIAEVVDNPRDGMWLLCRILESPDDPSLVGSTDSIFVHDVVELLD
jgi:hypothetical protein